MVLGSGGGKGALVGSGSVSGSPSGPVKSTMSAIAVNKKRGPKDKLELKSCRHYFLETFANKK